MFPFIFFVRMGVVRTYLKAIFEKGSNSILILPMPISGKLAKYNSKRDFKKTSEPKGAVKRKKSKNSIFVVQKHQASHLHYDFRLEVGGVLKSWAVPKGPSKNSKDKRLAVMTEDHPIEYAKFQGEIPEGEYGGGRVEIWDSGAYESEKSMKSAVRDGQIEIELFGKRLKGKYALIRTKIGGNSKNWLLIRMKE